MMKQSCSSGITIFIYTVIFPEREGCRENACMNICTPMPAYNNFWMCK